MPMSVSLALKLATMAATAIASPLSTAPTYPQVKAGAGAGAGIPVETVDLVRFRVEPEDRMVVRVLAPGPTALNFLIDTAAERSAISREAALRLGLRPAGPVSIVSFGGSHNVPTVRVPSLHFSKTTRNDLVVLTFPDEIIGADGFLGVDALQDKKIEFDFVRDRMTVRHARAVAGEFEMLESTTVKASRRNGRLVFSDAMVNGVKADVLLDTGSSITIGNLALRDALRAKGRLGPTVPVRLLSITGEIIVADYGTVKDVMLDGVEFLSMPMAFSTQEPFRALSLDRKPAVLLGMDALRTFGGVMVDFRSRNVRFATRNDGDTTFRIFGHRSRGR